MLLVLLAVLAADLELRIDCSATAGRFRPLHGVNGGPLNAGETVDLTAAWREAGIPLARMHDCEWPAGNVVDFHAVFPRLDADPAEPKSYRFAPTDDYLAGVAKSGARIVYRLGESIEHTRTKHHVHPPADYDRWTAACLGIIRHTNEGWAGGPRLKIDYWEIWNEPENRPAMWSGSDEDYYRLYATAATAIKREFPALKVGGPAVGATGDVALGRYRPTEFVRGFVERCRDRKLPLDFFSWHTYSDDPPIYARKARAIRQWLDELGFAKTEIHLNEWNYLPNDKWDALSPRSQGKPRREWYEAMHGPRGAAFVAYVLLELQASPIEQANYFHGDSSPFGLFSEHGEPRKTYYAFLAFRRLLDTPLRLKATGGTAGQSIVAAGMSEDRKVVRVLVANYASEAKRAQFVVERLPWDGATQYELRRLDATHDLEPVLDDRHDAGAVRVGCELEPGIFLLTLKPAG